MPDEKLVPPRGNDDTSLPVEERWAPPRTPGGYAEPYYGEDSAEAGIDWRRYVYAVARYRSLVVTATFLGAVGGYLAWGAVEPEYTAQGSLWIEVSTRASAGDVSPIRQSGLLESNAWIELLRTYAVLDTVVLQERLYLRYPREYAAAFEDFGLADRYAPGDFRLTLAESGELFRLATDFGGEIQRGTLGDSIGAEMGFR
ncbi:MAG: hypothetical protein OEZ37_13460, partial [Gemmatimonadota bacterium]|nr:hypothetical protein [Gemmatimonadota bacterium]